MKYLAIIILFSLSSCYIYKPYEPIDENDFLTFKEQIQPENKYKIYTAENSFKIIADQWDGDSLIAFKDNKREDSIIFAENQIQKVEHHVFSRGRSDLLTFGAYGAIGVIIYLLLQ